MYKLVAKYVYSIYYTLILRPYFSHPLWFPKTTPQTPLQKIRPSNYLFQKQLGPSHLRRSWKLMRDTRNCTSSKKPMRWIVFRRPCFYKGRDPSGVLLVLARKTRGPFALREIPNQGFLNMKKANVWRVDDGDIESLLDVLRRKKTNIHLKIDGWKTILSLWNVLLFRGHSFVFRWKNRWKSSASSFVFFPGFNWHLSIFFLRIVFVSVVLFLWHLLQKGSLHLFLFLMRNASRQIWCPSAPGKSPTMAILVGDWTTHLKNMRASQIGSNSPGKIPKMLETTT